MMNLRQREKNITMIYLFAFQMSLLSGVSQDGNWANFVAPEQRAIYQGTMCCIKSINLELKKQELSRKTMKSMR